MELASLLVIVVVALGGDPPPANEGVAATRPSARRLLDLARQYEFFADRERLTKFELQPKPLLTYSNPVRGDVQGSVFVWTRDARPEVVGAFFDFRTEDKLDSELHALATAGIAGWRDGREFWNPAKPGVKFQSVPGSQDPAATPVARLRQMRELAGEFTVEREHPEQGKGQMRLLPQPIYRYASLKANVADGAMFVYVEGTDPEAYLLIEARGGESPQWEFAFARMNIVKFTGAYKGDVVWEVGEVSWDEVFDRHEPYAIIREQPRRGLVRSRQ
jgi:hypothetical protein